MLDNILNKVIKNINYTQTCLGNNFKQNIFYIKQTYIYIYILFFKIHLKFRVCKKIKFRVYYQVMGYENWIFFLFFKNFLIININYLFYKRKKKQFNKKTVLHRYSQLHPTDRSPQTDFQLPNSASASLSCVRHCLQMME